MFQFQREENGPMKFPTSRLKGRTAIVTGGSKGIGYGMALALAQVGADIAIVSRHLDEAEKAAENMRQFSGNAIGICCDVTSVQQIDEMVGNVMARFGKIDILLNNAGMNIRKPIVEVQEDDWDRVIDTNLKGIFFVAQRVAKEMIKQRSGKVINIGSVCSSVGIRQLGAYAASKGGVAMLTKVMALEWAPYNIQVNGIAPPYVNTPMTAGWMNDPERLKWIIDSTPLGRLGEIDDLAGPVVFLAGDMSNFVTGHMLSADGGWIVQ
jgi:2-deoxy-D-gluconate 3-dehydrogenase